MNDDLLTMMLAGKLILIVKLLM